MVEVSSGTATVTFAEVDGRTLLTLLVQHTSKEHRDVHVNSGMEDGLQDALDLLEQVVGSLPLAGRSVRDARPTT